MLKRHVTQYKILPYALSSVQLVGSAIAHNIQRGSLKSHVRGVH